MRHHFPRALLPVMRRARCHGAARRIRGLPCLRIPQRGRGAAVCSSSRAPQVRERLPCPSRSPGGCKASASPSTPTGCSTRLASSALISRSDGRPFAMLGWRSPTESPSPGCRPCCSARSSRSTWTGGMALGGRNPLRCSALPRVCGANESSSSLLAEPRIESRPNLVAGGAATSPTTPAPAAGADDVLGDPRHWSGSRPPFACSTWYVDGPATTGFLTTPPPTRRAVHTALSSSAYLPPSAEPSRQVYAGPLGYVSISCTRSPATHSALPQVRPEPRRGWPHRQVGRKRVSQAAYASSSAMPPGPGTETTGRIPPPGSASHSRGLSAAGSSGTDPMTPFSSIPEPRRLLARAGDG